MKVALMTIKIDRDPRTFPFCDDGSFVDQKTLDIGPPEVLGLWVLLHCRKGLVVLSHAHMIA
jgi:hypothetical protein